MIFNKSTFNANNTEWPSAEIVLVENGQRRSLSVTLDDQFEDHWYSILFHVRANIQVEIQMWDKGYNRMAKAISMPLELDWQPDSWSFQCKLSAEEMLIDTYQQLRLEIP